MTEMIRVGRRAMGGEPIGEYFYKIRHSNEEGLILAYKTDWIDRLGKRTFYVVRDDGNLEPWHLFEDEWSEAND